MHQKQLGKIKRYASNAEKLWEEASEEENEKNCKCLEAQAVWYLWKIVELVKTLEIKEMKVINYFDYSLIPEHMMSNIQGYLEGIEYLGGFLFAVFSNDLFGAVQRADNENLALLPVYVKFIYNKCPIGSHGSAEIVKAWTEKKEREKRLNK
jgi:hypothetical protein